MQLKSLLWKTIIVLAGTFSTVASDIAVQPSMAQSVRQSGAVRQPQICRQNGEYAVFGNHPLFLNADRLARTVDTIFDLITRNFGSLFSERTEGKIYRDLVNLELAHEHIFFCRGEWIVGNVGFGPGEKPIQFELIGKQFTLDLPGDRFSYSLDELAAGRGRDGGRIDDFVPIDNEKYDADIVRAILSGVTSITPDRCELRPVGTYVGDTRVIEGDGVYVLGVINNCQGFTERVRNEYWRKMFAGTWIARGLGCVRKVETQKVEIAVRENALVATKIIGDSCVPAGAITFRGTIPRNVSKGSSFSVTTQSGEPNRPACCSDRNSLTIIDANTFRISQVTFTRED
ncbi:hypothetical protein [Roseofilum casamattae]|uniref:Uncharacterized protein n=1 Tax=Roseofilum casamattae BLCC-M143 TaxID=3022442 RepID=A0ABT7BVJ1_9CYAN|nr:hypothetical protein [Roseofilum casamattae]MDJ1183212.1 hypothetical protein [Roseofilum casamattae BLCC-M143]